MLQPLATPFDLGEIPGVAADPTSLAARRALRIATNAVIADLRWDPREQERTMTLPAHWHRPGMSRHYLMTDQRYELALPARNVTAVAVSINGSPLATTAYAWSTDSSIVRLLPGSLWGWQAGAITYTAGWPDTDMPEAIVDAVLDRAAELLENPRGLRSWTVGEVSETYMTGRDEAATAMAIDPRLAPYAIPPSIA